MNIKKTKFKSLRLWVISLLAVSTAAFSTSLVLSSCTTTSNNSDQEIKSDVTINKQPETNQEVSADHAGGVTLAIEATSSKGKELKYQWYQNKNDNNGWQPIQGATSSSYIIPSTELKAVTTEATWEYKAEIQYKDGTDAKFESSTYSVKVKPVQTQDTISFATDLESTVAITAGDEKTFSVLAKTSAGNAELTYDWYLDTGKGASKVQSSSASTYTIQSTSTSSFTDVQNWKLYVEAYPSNNNSLKATSKVCAITINPKTSGGTETPKGTISFSTNLETTKSITAGDTPTFTVLAEAKNVNNSTITYKWLLDRNGAGTYEAVKTSTDASYTMPASETQNISAATNWSLKVEAYATSDPSVTVTSDICTITINPKSGGTTPTQTIYPRAFDSNGLTTVQYDQEKWLGDNEVSVAIESTPNISYIQKFASDYLTKNVADNSSSNDDVKNAYSIISSLNEKLENTANYKTASLSAGTGWILDYSEGTSNLVNYYIATNIHVLEASYSIRYNLNVDINNVNTNATVTVAVPINKQTASSASVYLSQPQYNETSADNNTKVPFDVTQTDAWYKTSINIDNINDSLIPLGSFTTNGVSSTSTPYLMQVSYSYISNGYNNVFSYYYPTSGATGSSRVSYSTQPTTDFAVLKITEDKNAFNNIKAKPEWAAMFTKMQTMFNVETDNTKVAKNSSYIARLNALLSMATSDSYNKNTVNDLFMFADHEKDLNDNTIVSVGGFPATNGTRYLNFNSNTLSYSLHTRPNAANYRGLINYTYQGNMNYSTYGIKNEIFLTSVDLMGGSSGSMNVTQDYKILGIYWGIVTSSASSSALWGATTEVYSYNDADSMVMKWLKYVQANDSGSKLGQLFSALKTKGYFN